MVLYHSLPYLVHKNKILCHPTRDEPKPPLGHPSTPTNTIQPKQSNPSKIDGIKKEARQITVLRSR
jgi:hypothetical protein